ncbi:MAG TPA: DUF2752 domain-containing protein [Polyangiaceae bacterium]|nr:DUF2752 domain-containing protein [Polyangiaceae bacterium]
MPKVAPFAPDTPLGLRAQPHLRWLSLGVAAAAVLRLTAGDWLACPMQQLFHHACPTCGMSRALGLLLHGQFAESFTLQPLTLPAVACSWLVLGAGLEGVLRGTAAVSLWRSHRWLFAVTASVFFLVFALWLARSLGYAGAVG